jgi:hypothetical protein
MSELAWLAATRLAQSLDNEDYAAARQLLAEACVYQIGTTTIVGPDQILASYRANGQTARSRFDAIQYTHRVESVGPTRAIITYTDRVCLGNEWHTYVCRQHILVGLEGTVEEIEHEELPVERERLREFENRRPRNVRGG